MSVCVQATDWAISYFHQNRMKFEVLRKQTNFVAMAVVWRKLQCKTGRVWRNGVCRLCALMSQDFLELPCEGFDVPFLGLS